jgi:predicted AAA+ superfamily ATPase
MDILPRNIVNLILPWLDRDEIIIILGARQVGKSFVLYYLKNLLGEKSIKTFFIDLEDIELRASLTSPRSVISHLEAMGWRRGEKAVLFIDEFHYAKNGFSTLKYLHDHFRELKLIVTGSSSLRLKFKLEEPLTGRKIVFILYPLSFVEFLLFSRKEELGQTLERTKENPLPVHIHSQIASLYEQYLIYGGYPKVAMEPSHAIKGSLLKEIQTTYLDKEVRGLIREENFPKFKSLVEFLASQNGGLLKVLEVSKEVGIARDTVGRYLTLLEETYMISLLRPWAKNRQKEITHLPKFYFLDTGFLNFTLKDFRPLSLRADAGKLIENALFTQLSRRIGTNEEIRFYRTRTGEEIDFLLRRAAGTIPVEVKWRKESKVPKTMWNLLENNKSKNGIMITPESAPVKKIGSASVTFLPPWALEFALWKQ